MDVGATLARINYVYIYTVCGGRRKGEGMLSCVEDHNLLRSVCDQIQKL
jgi:hypothetical protein